MAKTIKFNLICDDHPIRTLDDLREHFCIEDVLKYYRNDLLQRWLSVRGYDEELAAVSNISCTDDISIINEIIGIFGVETDRDTIIKNTYVLKYQEEDIERHQQYETQKYRANIVIDEYYMGYKKLIEQIIENKDDWAVIKAIIQEIDDKYQNIFDIDYRTLFITFYQCAPMALFAMLSHENMRKKYLSELGASIEENQETQNPEFFIKSKWSLLATCIPSRETEEIVAKIEEDRKQMIEDLTSLTTPQKLREIFGKNLYEYDQNTHECWNAIAYNSETKEHPKCLILHVQHGCVRPMNRYEEKYEPMDVNSKFVILDGIEFYGKNSLAQVLYVEV